MARTVLRPGFDQLTPAVLLEEPTNRFATEGNPNLAQETAWGIDVGFDQKIGDRGIFGFNFFNRNIRDKIELAGTGRTTNFPPATSLAKILEAPTRSARLSLSRTLVTHEPTVSRSISIRR